MAEKYADLAGYRQIGLVLVPPPPLSRTSAHIIANGQNSADDLIAEENDVVQEAIKRLPPKVAYDRMFRMRRAVQVSCPPLGSKGGGGVEGGGRGGSFADVWVGG